MLRQINSLTIDFSRRTKNYYQLHKKIEKEVHLPTIIHRHRYILLKSFDNIYDKSFTFFYAFEILKSSEGESERRVRGRAQRSRNPFLRESTIKVMFLNYYQHVMCGLSNE